MRIKLRIRSPAETSISLLAANIVLLVLIAHITGFKHSKPTIEATTISTSLLEHISSRPSLPNNISVSFNLFPCFLINKLYLSRFVITAMLVYIY